jgi:hypothetical protein
VKLVHNIGTAFVVEVSAVILVHQRSLLSLELSAIDCGLSLSPVPLDPDLEPINVLISPDDLVLTFFIIILCLLDLVSTINIFII